MEQGVTSTVIHNARMLGLCDGSDRTVINKVRQMVKCSAPITHPKGNRRFDSWVFKIKKDTVISVHIINCTSCEDKKKIRVFDDCAYCEGEGCTKCHMQGGYTNLIPCPDCSST